MGKDKKAGRKTIKTLCGCLAALFMLAVPSYGASPERSAGAEPDLSAGAEQGLFDGAEPDLSAGAESELSAGAEPGLSGGAEEERPDETAYTAVDGNTIAEERLKDGIVEYDELGSLVHYGNLTIQQMTESTERTRQRYQEIRDHLRIEKDSADAKKEEAKEEEDMEGYAEYTALKAVYSSAAKNYNEMIKKLDRYSANKDRLSLEKQLTCGAQSLMISWQSMELQKEYLEKTAELYKAVYEDTKLRQSAGLATETDVSAACQDWEDAELSLAGIQDNEAQILQNLYLLLGTDDTVRFARIPPADIQKLAEIDLEADIQKAIGNNTDVIAKRNTRSTGTSSAEDKTRTLDGLEEKIKIKMEQLYGAVSQGKQAYDAASIGLDGAKLRWQNAQGQYALGMLSRRAYLQEELSYMQKKMAFDLADLALVQALEEYDWAVKGIVTLDNG